MPDQTSDRMISQDSRGLGASSRDLLQQVSYYGARAALPQLEPKASSIVRKIPDVMHHKHWLRAEKLMRRWFNSPPFQYPSYQPPDTTTITMNWLLQFQRARIVYTA